MAVLASQRSLPNTDYYYNALQIRKNMTLLLLRDFGVKDKVRTVDFYAKMAKMNDEDTETFAGILDKYNLNTKILEEYPSWLIKQFRDNILNTMYKLVYYITQGDSIQTPSSFEICKERQVMQQKAIGCCNQLLQDMQYVMDILPIDAEKLMPYVGAILEEIEAIKRWRKRTNKDFARFKEIDKDIPDSNDADDASVKAE